MRISDWSSDVCSSDLLAPFALWAIVVAFLSATQDIVIDAYRIEILSDAELPHGTALNQFGSRPGNLIAGVGTIALDSPEGCGLGWETADAVEIGRDGYGERGGRYVEIWVVGDC